MLTILGGGPGVPGLLTQSAVEALDRAHAIYLESGVRNVLGERREWLEKVREGSAASADAEVLDGETVWVVPDTPALYAPVRRFVETLDANDLQMVRIVSGIPTSLDQLDRDGVLLPEHGATLWDGDGEPLIQWKDGRWQGRWLDRRVMWSRARPLYGTQVVLLRSSAGAARARRWFEDWGAEVHIYPISRLMEPDHYDFVDAAIRRVERYNWVIFTSGEAVVRWFARMRRLGQDVRGMQAKIAAVGPETAVKVRERGLVPALMPEQDYSQEGLVEAFRDVPVRGSVMLFPGGQLNRNFLADELRGRGALVDTLLLYQNVRQPMSLALHQAIRSELVDAMVFTASSQVEYLMEQLAVEDRRHLCRIPIFSIGPLTTRMLEHYSLQPAGEPPEPSLRLLAECVRDYHAGLI